MGLLRDRGNRPALLGPVRRHDRRDDRRDDRGDRREDRAMTGVTGGMTAATGAPAPDCYGDSAKTRSDYSKRRSVRAMSRLTRDPRISRSSSGRR